MGHAHEADADKADANHFAILLGGWPDQSRRCIIGRRKGTPRCRKGQIHRPQGPPAHMTPRCLPKIPAV